MDRDGDREIGTERERCLPRSAIDFWLSANVMTFRSFLGTRFIPTGINDCAAVSGNERTRQKSVVLYGVQQRAGLDWVGLTDASPPESVSDSDASSPAISWRRIVSLSSLSSGSYRAPGRRGRGAIAGSPPRQAPENVPKTRPFWFGAPHFGTQGSHPRADDDLISLSVSLSLSP
jgi:hypothetical protein